MVDASWLAAAAAGGSPAARCCLGRRLALLAALLALAAAPPRRCTALDALSLAEAANASALPPSCLADVSLLPDLAAACSPACLAALGAGTACAVLPPAAAGPPRAPNLTLTPAQLHAALLNAGEAALFAPLSAKLASGQCLQACWRPAARARARARARAAGGGM